MNFNYLQKIVISATLISLTIFFDVFFNIFFPFNTMPYGGSIFKISCLPLFLIGFLFGFKYSFLSCLFFSFYHLYKIGFFGLEIILNILNQNHIDRLTSYLFDYIIPDLVFSIAGFFYMSNFKHFDNSKKIFLSLFLIYFLIIISRVISFHLVWLKAIDINKLSGLFSFLKSLFQYNSFIYAIIYNLIPSIINFLVNGIMLSFLNVKIKIYCDNHFK